MNTEARLRTRIDALRSALLRVGLAPRVPEECAIAEAAVHASHAAGRALGALRDALFSTLPDRLERLERAGLDYARLSDKSDEAQEAWLVVRRRNDALRTVSR